MTSYVKVCEDVGKEDQTIELPTEDDQTLLLSTLASQFSGASGLRFRIASEGNIRGVKLQESKLYPPNGSWNEITYYCVFPKGRLKYYST